MGGKIEELEVSTILIEGVNSLKEGHYKVISDRIEVLIFHNCRSNYKK